MTRKVRSSIELNAAALAVEQLGAEATLEIAHMRRNRRLTDIELSCSTGKTAFRCDVMKRFKPLLVH